MLNVLDVVVFVCDFQG